MLSVGIVGLPNVGKSTLFNTVAAGRAEVSNYPFTTIDSNVGVVSVPDPRLCRLRDLLAPEKTTPCAIRFIDIAGLVAGASRGEGLGNQFLGEIRQVDALAHVLRCFASEDVAHVFSDVDPLRDAAVVETELILADLEVLYRAIAKRERDWRTRPRDHAAEQARFETYRDALESGTPLRSLDLDAAAADELKTIGLTSGKPVLWVANVDESDAVTGGGWPEKLGAAFPDGESVALAAAFELELAELEPDDRREFIGALGLETSGLERMVRHAFRLLGLISFYTVVKNKLQAWAIPSATPAPSAAGRVHSDMERGFISARVVAAEELLAAGDLAALQRAGRVRTEGKGYRIEDGDVVEFLFNV